MNKIPIISVMLLLIAIAGCGAPSASTTPASPATTTPAIVTTVPATTSANRIDFVYFHPKRRCALCLNVEIQIKSFLENNYKEQVKSGLITFTSYELEDKSNAAIVKKYGALSSQFFVNTLINGKDNILHVEKVWLPEVYDDSTAFENFMKEIVSKSLEAIK